MAGIPKDDQRKYIPIILNSLLNYKTIPPIPELNKPKYLRPNTFEYYATKWSENKAKDIQKNTDWILTPKISQQNGWISQYLIRALLKKKRFTLPESKFIDDLKKKGLLQTANFEYKYRHGKDKPKGKTPMFRLDHTPRGFKKVFNQMFKADAIEQFVKSDYFQDSAPKYDILREFFNQINPKGFHSTNTLEQCQIYYLALKDLIFYYFAKKPSDFQNFWKNLQKYVPYQLKEHQRIDYYIFILLAHTALRKSFRFPKAQFDQDLANEISIHYFSLSPLKRVASIDAINHKQNRRAGNKVKTTQKTGGS